VDYGIFWPVAKILFWFLCRLNSYLGNWGFSIIVLTIFIKVLFYPLSSISYTSMKHTRRLQPDIVKLKEQFSNDKQSYGNAVMSLYKKEKVNPLSGCLPLVAQIPFFISLYYVILEAVELRKEPFIFWITDLSTYDTFYVLPVLMGVTMFLQQKLSPKPTDEIQEKFMLILPFVFTFLFLNFPAGLVLYWVINNSCSILQQWYITHKN
jgi:YidC/Oxa1 family membrane protein insertase